MSDDLDAKTDSELSELFAVEVAGWVKKIAMPPFEDQPGIDTLVWFDESGAWVNDDQGDWDKPKFATDANVVLPWLEKFSAWTLEYIKAHTVMSYRVNVMASLNAAEPSGYAFSPVFARAAVIALIRAKRAQS